MNISDSNDKEGSRQEPRTPTDLSVVALVAGIDVHWTSEIML